MDMGGFPKHTAGRSLCIDDKTIIYSPHANCYTIPSGQCELHTQSSALMTSIEINNARIKHNRWLVDQENCGDRS